MTGRARQRLSLRPRLRPGGRPAALIASAGLALGALAGCSSSGGASAETMSTGSHPIVRADQAQGILTAVGISVDQATAPSGTESTFGPRIVGPTLQLMTTLRKLPASLRTDGPIGNQSWQRLIVPRQTGWPRWFLAVGSPGSRPTPLLSVLYSGSARTPYGLWAQLVLLPGQQVPEVAPAELGAPVLAGSAPGFRVAPGQVAGQYADLLDRGAASPAAKLFSTDVFGQQVSRQLATDRAEFIKYGTVTAQQAAVPGASMALRTADGGALVIAELTQTYQVTVRPSAGTVKIVDAQLAALAGKNQFTHRVIRTSQELVAFVVPPAGSSQQVRVVAAAKAALSATGS